jgi:hypothetical protein
MSEPSQDKVLAEGSSEERQPAGQQGYGSLTVEDDPTGTEDPADLAGTANSGDEQVGPAAHQ